MPRHYRLALLPFAAVAELAMLGIAWLLSWPAPALAGRIAALAERVPDAGWYSARA